MRLCVSSSEKTNHVIELIQYILLDYTHIKYKFLMMLGPYRKISSTYALTYIL
jgi:hypothetical protein